jgi:hypothetical protein
MPTGKDQVIAGYPGGFTFSQRKPTAVTTNHPSKILYTPPTSGGTLEPSFYIPQQLPLWITREKLWKKSINWGKLYKCSQKDADPHPPYMGAYIRHHPHTKILCG